MKVSDLHLTPNEHIKHKKIFFFTGEFNGSSPPERVQFRSAVFSPSGGKDNLLNSRSWSGDDPIGPCRGGLQSGVILLIFF